MAVRGTAAAPIATPSRDYGQKLAHRDYQGEKEEREALRTFEAEERRKQRETGLAIDLGHGGSVWKDISEGDRPAPNQRTRQKSYRRSMDKRDDLDLWWAEEKGEESLQVGAPSKAKKKRKPKSQRQKMPAWSSDTTTGDQSWKLWGSRDVQDSQGWKSWDAQYTENDGGYPAKTSKPATGKSKPATGKAKPKTAPKKSKAEKVNVWDAWKVSENQPDDEFESREIILSGYLGPDLSDDRPTSASEEHAAASCEDQPEDSLVPCDDQVVENPAPEFEDVSLHTRLVHFLQHRDKGDDSSRSEAREFLRKVAKQEKEVGAFGKLAPDDVEVAIASWDRRLWCMAWLREKDLKDELEKAMAILRHAANKGIEFPGVGVMKLDEVEDAIEEYEQEDESDSEGNGEDVGAEAGESDVLQRFQ